MGEGAIVTAALDAVRDAGTTFVGRLSAVICGPKESPLGLASATPLGASNAARDAAIADSEAMGAFLASEVVVRGGGGRDANAGVVTEVERACANPGTVESAGDRVEAGPEGNAGAGTEAGGAVDGKADTGAKAPGGAEVNAGDGADGGTDGNTGDGADAGGAVDGNAGEAVEGAAGTNAEESVEGGGGTDANAGAGANSGTDAGGVRVEGGGNADTNDCEGGASVARGLLERPFDSACRALLVVAADASARISLGP